MPLQLQASFKLPIKEDVMHKLFLPVFSFLLSGALFAQDHPTFIEEEEEEKKSNEEVAGPENRYEYNLYDRQQNRLDESQRQQYYYYQSDDSQNSSPQYNRQSQDRFKYFNPSNE